MWLDWTAIGRQSTLNCSRISWVWWIDRLPLDRQPWIDTQPTQLQKTIRDWSPARAWLQPAGICCSEFKIFSPKRTCKSSWQDGTRFHNTDLLGEASVVLHQLPETRRRISWLLEFSDPTWLPGIVCSEAKDGMNPTDSRTCIYSSSGGSGSGKLSLFALDDHRRRTGLCWDGEHHGRVGTEDQALILGFQSLSQSQSPIVMDLEAAEVASASIRVTVVYRSCSQSSFNFKTSPAWGQCRIMPEEEADFNHAKFVNERLIQIDQHAVQSWIGVHEQGSVALVT